MDKMTDTRWTKLMAAAGAGALLMYLLDPTQGRRRVARARDQSLRLARRGRDAATAAIRDLTNRAHALVAKTRGAVHDGPPSDDVLVERVRARLGRLVSHPHAVHASAQSGRVTLTGPVLASEEQQLLHGVRAVRGVRDVESRLEVHKTADHRSALQGGSGRPRQRMEFMQENWAPGPRLVALAAGGVLAGYGLARRGWPGVLLGLAGGALIARATTNQGIGRLLGVTNGTRGIDIQKIIHIAAPRETVFDLWSNYDNFPHFMSHVEEVRPLDEARSHWVVKGPAGTRFEWNSMLTERNRPHMLAWRSEPGSPVQHAGIVRLDEASGGTRVTVRMSYNPPGGALGHSIAALLGRDPKRDLDADLLRMKAFVETGIPPHDAAHPAIIPPRPELQAAATRQLQDEQHSPSASPLSPSGRGAGGEG
jgi:uncharacterized membrane protein